jgi:NADH-quinone oxidoreductase subunit N
LIEATVEGDYTWLGVAIVIGTMVSLAYYLRVVAAVWMAPSAASSALPAGSALPDSGLPAVSGASPEADRKGTGRCVLIWGSAVLCAAATVFFGIVPSPLIDWASNAGFSLAFH